MESIASRYFTAWVTSTMLPAGTRQHAMYDMKNLTRLKKLDANAPHVMKSFWAFDKAVFVDGALTTLQKQLIAVAVALTTQCPYCIEIHAKEARKAGATDAHLSEAAMVAAALRAGGTVTHASHLFGDGHARLSANGARILRAPFALRSPTPCKAGFTDRAATPALRQSSSAGSARQLGRWASLFSFCGWARIRDTGRLTAFIL